jgi:hypothetical protein
MAPTSAHNLNRVTLKPIDMIDDYLWPPAVLVAFAAFRASTSALNSSSVIV